MTYPPQPQPAAGDAYFAMIDTAYAAWNAGVVDQRFVEALTDESFQGATEEQCEERDRILREWMRDAEYQQTAARG